MNLTTDQLSYILERKYQNIKIGQDVLIVCSSCMENNTLISNPDAFIIEWYLPNIPQPSVQELEITWNNIKDQYNSDPNREDSEMALFLKQRDVKFKPTVIINEDI